MLIGVEPLVRRDVPNILLSHNPNSFPRAAELGIELSLAGHTHGGQVRVEILDHRWSPARFLTPYVAGLTTGRCIRPRISRDAGNLRPDSGLNQVCRQHHLRESRPWHDRRAGPPGRSSGNYADHAAPRVTQIGFRLAVLVPGIAKLHKPRTALGLSCPGCCACAAVR